MEIIEHREPTGLWSVWPWQHLEAYGGLLVVADVEVVLGAFAAQFNYPK
jgi:hypothetical protein